MIKKIETFVAALLIAVVLCGTTPRAARADIQQVLIITSAVAGGLVLISIIGTSLMRDDPRFLPLDSRPLNSDPLHKDTRVRFGARCPQIPDGALAVCW